MSRIAVDYSMMKVVRDVGRKDSPWKSRLKIYKKRF